MGQVDLLFLHPPNEGPFHYFLLPVGVPGLLNQVKREGAKVLGLNLGLAQYLRRNWKRELRSLPEPKVIALDLHWYEHIQGALDTLHFVRQIFPRAKTVVGGFTASDFPVELFAASPALDFIVTHYAEMAFPKLVQAILHEEETLSLPNIWQRRDGTLLPPSHEMAPHTLDTYDYADFSCFADAEEYLSIPSPQFTPHFITVYSGRGCPLNCSFCEGARPLQEEKGLGRRLKRSVSHLLADIEKLARSGVKRFKPNLDLYLLSPSTWQPFFAELRELPFRIGLLHEFWHLPSPAFLEAMAASVDISESACIFSPLSPDESVRRENGKHYRDEELFETLRICRKLRLRCELCFSPYLPGETNSSFQKISPLVKEARKIVAPLPLDLSCYPITPDPQSATRRRHETPPTPYTFSFYRKLSCTPHSISSLRKKWGLVPLGYRQKGANLALMQWTFAKTLFLNKLATSPSEKISPRLQPT